MQSLFAGEMQSLSHELCALAAQHRIARDIPVRELTQVLREVTACLPVYRTYIRGDDVSAQDRLFLNRALALARQRVPQHALSDAAFSFLRQVLLIEPPEYSPELREGYLHFVMRWQQFTGPVMAKGLEDTASYVHNSLISLNDVGSDPLRECLPTDLESFHLFNRERQRHWPTAMNTTSTHDTKRGEDVRARIDVLSELADEWIKALRRWHRGNAEWRSAPAARSAPSPEEESLIYQTLLGAWPSSDEELPDFRGRMKGFVIKASREAKLHTDWINPNTEHEAALEGFLDALFDAGEESVFRRDSPMLQAKVAFYGHLNSLSQTLLKIASPGVPDFYQGEELWDYNLVDPDNRRPVDFRLRSQLLEEMKDRDHRDRKALLRELCENWNDGRIKLYLIWKALNFRRAHQELFREGTYVPLTSLGRRCQNICAFCRVHEGQHVLVVAPRLFTRVAKLGQLPLGRAVWGDASITLPNGFPPQWQDVLTGENITDSSTRNVVSLRVADLLCSYPVSLCLSLNSR